MLYYYDPIDPCEFRKLHTDYPVSDDSDDVDGGCFTKLFGIFLIILFCIIVSIITGCTTTRTLTVERVKNDTVIMNHIHYDSIYVGSVIHDSVIERQRGDTLYIDRWHTRVQTQYRDRWLYDSIYINKHDSIYIYRRDTVRVPRIITQTVPARLSAWQQVRIWLANIIVSILAVCALVWLWRKRSWWLGLFRKLF